MRSRITFSCLLMLVTLGCGSSRDVSGPNGNLPQGSMSARIDGANWSATIGLAATYANNILAVGGSDGSRTISFALVATTTGTFPVSGTSGANGILMIAGTGQSWQAAATLGSGTITIATLTATTASGTFSFSLAPNSSSTGNRIITDGKFNVKF